VAIIRGGGSVTELSWLNDFELAAEVCRFRVPVLSGIGHERDRGILDEVANQAFDTPSKVAIYIRECIFRNAADARVSLDFIRNRARFFLASASTALAESRDALESRSLRLLSEARHASERRKEQVELLTRGMLPMERRHLDELQTAVRSSSWELVKGARDALEHSREELKLLAGIRVSHIAETLAALASQVAERGRRRTTGIESVLDAQAARLLDDLKQILRGERRGLDRLYLAIESESGRALSSARRQVQASLELLLAVGPDATLRRGFSIIRGTKGVVTSRAQAARYPILDLQFHDGTLTVANESLDRE